MSVDYHTALTRCALWMMIQRKITAGFFRLSPSSSDKWTWRERTWQDKTMSSPIPAPTFRLSFFLLAMLLSTASVADEPQPLSQLAKLEELTQISAKLVRESKSAQANAASFRIEVTLYRESLRTLMLDNQKIAHEKERIPQNILINMVRMSALLSSASECRTGRYIVCPLELMRKLSAQQQLLFKDLERLKASHGTR